MATIWSERESGVSAREAKYRYQKKETELEDARASSTRLQAELRAKKEELARANRGIEKRQIEILQLEKTKRDLGRTIDDLERRMREQKARLSRLEHDVEQGREAAFRGRSSNN